MKKILIAATLSMFATAAMAQSAQTDAAQPSTSVNGVDSSTAGGQGTGSGTNMATEMPVTGTDATTTGSMTPDTGTTGMVAGEGENRAGGNSNATTSVNGVDSSTSAGQGTGAGADVAK